MGAKSHLGTACAKARNILVVPHARLKGEDSQPALCHCFMHKAQRYCHAGAWPCVSASVVLAIFYVSAQKGGSYAGKVKTEIIHFLANTFTLDKFRSQRQVLGTELVLTDFDEAEMSVQSVLDFMAHAQSDNKSPAVITLRAREGATLNLLRMYGKTYALLCFGLCSVHSLPNTKLRVHLPCDLITLVLCCLYELFSGGTP